VAGSASSATLARRSRSRRRRLAVYQPITPSGFASPSGDGVTVAVRVVPGFDAPTRLRQEIDAIDPDVTVFQITPMADEVTPGLSFHSPSFRPRQVRPVDTLDLLCRWPTWRQDASACAPGLERALHHAGIIAIEVKACAGATPQPREATAQPSR
jgi:hypothetical protein